MENRLKNVMSAVFQIPPEAITEQASPRDIQVWDSLEHMKLIVAIEEEFDIKFDYDEIQSLINYKVISSTVKAYLDQKNA